VSIIAELVKGGLSGIISPITATITAIATKKADTKVEEGKQDVAVIQSRNALLSVIHGDPAIATGFYLFIVPSGVHYALVIWDSCFRNLWPDWTWRVLEIPGNMQYIPYAVVAFLFGLAWRGKT
jgi:hypothetical protein